LDPRNLIIASPRGGEGIAVAADDRGASDNTAEKRVNAVAYNIDRLRIVQVGDKLMSANSVNQVKVEAYSTSSETIMGPGERIEGTTLDKGTELLALNERGEGLAPAEEREGLGSDEVREKLILDERR
jgi:hypothetical protein